MQRQRVALLLDQVGNTLNMGSRQRMMDSFEHHTVLLIP